MSYSSNPLWIRFIAIFPNAFAAYCLTCGFSSSSNLIRDGTASYIRGLKIESFPRAEATISWEAPNQVPNRMPIASHSHKPNRSRHRHPHSSSKNQALLLFVYEWGYYIESTSPVLSRQSQNRAICSWRYFLPPFMKSFCTLFLSSFSIWPW